MSVRTGTEQAARHCQRRDVPDVGGKFQQVCRRYRLLVAEVDVVNEALRLRHRYYPHPAYMRIRAATVQSDPTGQFCRVGSGGAKWAQAKGVRRIFIRGVNTSLPPEAKKIRKIWLRNGAF